MRESANRARFIISCPYLSLFVGITIILSPPKGRFLLKYYFFLLGHIGGNSFSTRKRIPFYLTDTFIKILNNKFVKRHYIFKI